MNKRLKDEFKFYIPIDIKKSENGKVADMILEGLAGDGGSDSEGENLSYDGFNLDRMFYINWEHSKEPEDVIGVILQRELRKGGKLFIKGKLFNDHKKAIDAYKLQEFLEKEGHNLGFSVEGKVIERDPINPKVVKKAELYGVALCKVPVNPVTYAKISKAFKTGVISDDIEKDEEEEDEEEVEKMATGDMAPTMPESVEKKKKNLEEGKILTKSEVYVRIFNKFTSEPILADKIYNLLKSITKMKNGENQITEDVILKAEKILGLVGDETSKEKRDEEIEKSTDPKKVEGEGNQEIETLKKSMTDAHSDYLKKSEEYKALCEQNGIKPEIAEEEEVISKSFDPDIIKSAISEVIGEKLGILDKLEKSIEIRTKALGSLIAGDRQSIQSISEELKKANESIDLVKSFNDDLRERLNVVERTPVRKAVTTENFRERFDGEGKSGKDSSKTFNVNSMKDRESLAKSIETVYGNDLENPENVKMMEAASTLQMTGLVEPHQQQLLKSKGYELVQM